MLNERRETVRHAVNRPAKFQESPVMRECTIRDIEHGRAACRPRRNASDQFTLFDGGTVERRCLVIWRLGDLVGARFEK